MPQLHAMQQTPTGSGGMLYRSPVKQPLGISKPEHSSSSHASDKQHDSSATVTPYGRCPLIPCMPDLTRGSGSVTNQHPISELAGLHAALSSEGVQLHSPTHAGQPPPWQMKQQHQQQHQQQQQQQQPLEQHNLSPLRSGLQQHRQHPGSKPPVSQGDALLAPQLSGDLQSMATDLHTITVKLQGVGPRHSASSPAARLNSLMHGAGAAVAAQADPSSDAQPSMDIKTASQKVMVDHLREALSKTNELVTARQRRSCSPDKAAAILQARKLETLSGSSSSSSPSRASSNPVAPEQGLQQPSAMPTGLQQQQQQQELLGLAGSSRPNVLAASLSQQLAQSQGLQRLRQPPQQQQKQLASLQGLAQAGLQQLQDVTEVGQLLVPALAAQRIAVAEAQQGVSAIKGVLQKYPQYANPSALQDLLDSKKQLEACCEELRRELQAKELAHRNTLNVLRENTSTPRDRRMAQLQQENNTLQNQLLSRDSQLQRFEQELHALRSRGQQQPGSTGELSPVAAEGQRYDDDAIPPPAARLVNRSLWGAPLPTYAGRATGSSHSSSDGATSVSGSAGSSRSCTPSSGSSGGSVTGVVCLPQRHVRNPQQQLQQQQQLKADDITAQFERQMAAGRSTIPQLRQQLSALRDPNTQQEAAAGATLPIRRPGAQHTQHSTGDQAQQAAAQQHTDAHHAAIISNLKAQMQQQAERDAAMHADAVASLKRQVEVERRQHSTTQQRCQLWEGKAQQLEQQLGDARSQQQALQSQVQQLRQQLEQSSGGASSRSTTGGAASQRQLDWSLREMQTQLLQAQQAKAELQQQVDRLQDENQQQRSEVKQRIEQLLQAEKSLLNFQATKEALQQQCRQLEQQLAKAQEQQQPAQQHQQLEQRSLQLQQQRSAAQQAQAAAEGTAAECRRQLAAAEAERGVLMDRIRQLADRASLAEAKQQQHRDDTARSCPSRVDAMTPGSSSGGSGGGAGLQQELSAACAELNQQVAQLQRQLTEAETKEERLQVVNAQLQERLSRMQAECAARDASSQGSDQPAQPPQQQQQQVTWQDLQKEAEALQASKQQLEQQVPQLQQQVSDLQKQLAAATAAAAEAASVQPPGQHKEQQQQQQQPETQAPEEQQQRQQRQDAERKVVQLQEELQQMQMELEDRTLELQEWQIHADALEKDLEDVKAQLMTADGLQQQLDAVTAQLTAARSQQQQLQEELVQARSRSSQLEYDLHGMGQERAALRSRVDALTAELSATREGAADLRLRLEHFTGPAGPQARVRQLEASLHNVQRKYEAADSRAASAATCVSDLKAKLGAAEDQIVALEGHVSVLEEELAKYTQLPQ